MDDHHEQTSMPYSCATTYNLAKDCTIFVGLVVDGALDPVFLEKKQRELISLWPVLGGTIVTSTSPYSFTTGSIVDYKSRDFSDSSVRDFLPYDHTLPEYSTPASSITIRSSVEGDSGDDAFHFDSMRVMSLLPTSLFALRVTVLADATLLGFRLPHAFADGEGAFTAVKLFSMVCSGHALPPCILPPDADVYGGKNMSELVDVPEMNDNSEGGTIELPEYVHPSENFHVGVLPVAKFLASSLFNGASKTLMNMFKAKPEIAETKYIHLPGELVDSWQEECASALGPEAGVTRNDVISAWFTKAIYKYIPPETSSPLELMYVMSYHRMLSPPHNTQDFIHDSVFNMRIHFPSISDVQTQSLPEIAKKIRTCVRENQSPIAVKETLKFWEENALNAVAPGMAVHEDFMPFFSSWAGFTYCDLRFCKEEEGTKGKVLFTQHTSGLPMGMVLKNNVTILKDGCGGYWLRTNLYPDGWRGVRDSVPNVEAQ